MVSNLTGFGSHVFAGNERALALAPNLAVEIEGLQMVRSQDTSYL